MLIRQLKWVRLKNQSQSKKHYRRIGARNLWSYWRVHRWVGPRKKVVPPPPPTMYRYSFAINNIPIHSKPDSPQYYGCIGQVWVSEKSADIERKIKEKTVKFLEDYLGYEEDLWWEIEDKTFKIGEGWQKVLDRKKNKSFELRMEDPSGVTIDSEKGNLDED